jgi:ABC-type lipoprotein release transport system permease subunit
VGYQAAPEIGSVVKDPVAVAAVVADAVPGATTERRVLGAGLGGSGDASSGVMVNGIEPASRPLDVKRGKGLSPTAAREAVIGTELAEQLAVDVGGEIVLVGQAADGSVANDRYAVVGVADAGTFELNATSVFLHIRDAQELFALGDGVHQIVLRLPPERGDDLSEPLGALRSALDLAALEALSWNEILPELTGTIESKREGQSAIDFIIFLIVALGVLNAMTMATFERTRELGVMLALGTRPRRVVGLIVVESLLQGAIALAIGVGMVLAVFAAVGDLNLGATGMGGADFSGVRLPSTVALALSIDSVRAAAVVSFATVLAGGLWPAVRAARLRPVEAMGSTS